MMREPITVIDLGSNRIVAARGAVDRNNRVHFSALEDLHSRGIEGGEITDINKAIDDISSVMKRFERREKRRLKKIHVTTRGAGIQMAASRGMTPLSRTPREITGKDIRKCLELATLVKLPVDKAVMQKIIKGFTIDGGEASVLNPLGLYGIKLEVESFIAIASRSKIQNITKCIDHAGFLLDGIYLSSLASAGSILDAKEKEDGVLLLDIGGALTEELIFKNGILKGRAIIKKGANAKKPTALLKDALAAFPAGAREFSSVVLTGGGALLDGIIEEAEREFGVPARMGLVKSSGQSLNSQDALIHAPTIGLINHIAKEYAASRAPENPLRRILHNLTHIYETYF
jgi:cell division ATPase FtsA